MARNEFQKLVRGLDDEALDELHRFVASEAEARRQKHAIKLEDIRPGMSAEDLQRAREEIARLLGGAG